MALQIEQTFTIACAPGVVFDYVTDPANLSSWQTATASVDRLTPGPPRLGSRYREHVKGPLGRGFEQIVEFSEFERPRRLRVRVVQGPYPIDGSWTFEAIGDETCVHFIAAGELHGLLRLLQPLARRALARQFVGYHRNLRRNLERG
jgi:uncharacterized protein YndB with AHSA1/START domain